VFWQIGLVQFFCWFAFLFMWTYTTGGIAENVTVWSTIDTNTPEYQAAGDWTGILFAVQAIGSILWAMAIPRFRNVKFAYALSLVLGGVGFISTFFIHDQYLLGVSFLLIGCAWAAMLALPFALLTNALSGKSLGSYMGLFNCTICLPQIIASLVGGLLFMTFGGKDVYIDVPVEEEAKVEVVAEAEEPETLDAVILDEGAVESTPEVEEMVAEVEATTEPNDVVVMEQVTEEEVAAEATATPKTVRKKFQSGQIVMLVIAGISLFLGALAVFGINTRRKE
jgi:hypothetical protein